MWGGSTCWRGARWGGTGGRLGGGGAKTRTRFWGGCGGQRRSWRTRSRRGWRCWGGRWGTGGGARGGGWASNNKCWFLGGLRSTAQMLAYEIPLGLALLAALLVYGTVYPETIVRFQVGHGWMVFAQPLAAVLFFTAILAEANRAPFDNAEAESELVGGYHTEYSAMRFALFFLAEYAHMFTSSAFFALLFLGGYHLPFIPALSPEAVGFGAVLAKVLVYFLKVVLIVCFMMVVRWTVPRLRYDQVMMMGWQALIPFSIGVMILTAVMVYFDLRGLVPMLLANAALFALVLVLQPLLP